MSRVRSITQILIAAALLVACAPAAPVPTAVPPTAAPTTVPTAVPTEPPDPLDGPEDVVGIYGEDQVGTVLEVHPLVEASVRQMCEASGLPFDLSNLSLVKTGTTLLYFHSAPSEPFNRFMGLTSSKDGGWRIDVKASAYAWESADGDWYYNDENNKPVLLAQRTDKGLGIKDFDGNLNYATTESDGQGMFLSPISIGILDGAVSVGRNPEGILQAYDSTGEAIHYYDAVAGWIEIIREDFSDLHPESSIEEAMKSEYILSREDFPRAVSKAMAEAVPFPDTVEPPILLLVETPTGKINVEYAKHGYSKEANNIPCSIEAIYHYKEDALVRRFMKFDGIYMIVRYKTNEGDRFVTYVFSPLGGDPKLPLVDHFTMITPVFSTPQFEIGQDIFQDVPDDELGLNTFYHKYLKEGKRMIQKWIDEWILDQDLWKIPLTPNTEFQSLLDE